MEICVFREKEWNEMGVSFELNSKKFMGFSLMPILFDIKRTIDHMIIFIFVKYKRHYNSFFLSKQQCAVISKNKKPGEPGSS